MLASLAFVLGSVVSPRVADACSLLPQSLELVGYPENAASDVPTDVVPFYQAGRLRLDAGATFSLTASDGSAVPLIAEETHVSTLSLRPARSLAPNTRYVLAYESGGERDSVSFTTSSGPHASLPSPPSAFLEHYQWEPIAYDSCAPSTSGTCIAVPPGIAVEYASFDAASGVSFERSLSTVATMVDISGVAPSTAHDCVRLRTRAPNGTFSDPVVLCRDEGELISIRGGTTIRCTSDGLSFDGGRADGEPSSGPDEARASPRCSAGAQGRSASPLSAVLLLGLAALSALRRRGLRAPR